MKMVMLTFNYGIINVLAVMNLKHQLSAFIGQTLHLLRWAALPVI
jgi:hypothetical protein